MSQYLWTYVNKKRPKKIYSRFDRITVDSGASNVNPITPRLRTHCHIVKVNFKEQYNHFAPGGLNICKQYFKIHFIYFFLYQRLDWYSVMSTTWAIIKFTIGQYGAVMAWLIRSNKPFSEPKLSTPVTHAHVIMTQKQVLLRIAHKYDSSYMLHTTNAFYMITPPSHYTRKFTIYLHLFYSGCIYLYTR